MAKKSSKKELSNGVLLVASNKKARHDYEVLDTLEVGIVLKGSEVKAVREGSVNLKESYVRIVKEELFLVGAHISPYSHAGDDSHKPTRMRKLLAHRKEIERLTQSVERKGLSLIPIKIYFKNGRCKLEIATGRGKKIHDKRGDMKDREAKREIERVMKGGG